MHTYQLLRTKKEAIYQGCLIDSSACIFFLTVVIMVVLVVVAVCPKNYRINLDSLLANIQGGQVDR